MGNEILSHLAFESFKIGPLDQKLIKLTIWRKIRSLFCFLVLDQSADFWQARVKSTAESLDRMCMVTHFSAPHYVFHLHRVFFPGCGIFSIFELFECVFLYIYI